MTNMEEHHLASTTNIYSSHDLMVNFTQISVDAKINIHFHLFAEEHLYIFKADYFTGIDSLISRKLVNNMAIGHYYYGGRAVNVIMFSPLFCDNH